MDSTGLLGTKAFFSFVTVVDPERHADYNAWHQLDHLPENLALPGVLHGCRWVLTPACSALASRPHPDLETVHYVAVYWFAEPAAASIAAWQELAETSFQWGRRPDRGWVERPLMGFFSTVSALVSSRLALSARALPLRPQRGVQVTVTRVREPHGDASEAAFRWQDRSGVPALVERPGVAGAYVFSSDSTTLDTDWEERPGTTTFDAGGGERGQLRVYLCFLDGQPLECASSWPNPADPEGGEEVLFSAPLETIEPGRWDWFATGA